MNIAVCFSGELRSFNLVKNNIKEYFDKYLISYDIFASFIEGDDVTNFINFFPNANVEIYPEQDLDTTIIPKNNTFKTGVQKYLRQIYGWSKVNEFRKKTQELKNIEYDYILRCRPDIMFKSDFPDINTLSRKKLYLPKFHSWGGYNDRFCIGDPDIIDYYMDIFKYINKYPSLCTHSETFLKKHLDMNNIQVDLLDIKFNRVLSDGEELDDN